MHCVFPVARSKTGSTGMNNMRRAFVIILDGLGVGELPDAKMYGDEGSDTLGNLSKAVGGVDLPCLESMGLGCIHPARGLEGVSSPTGSYGKMAERSPGKDSTTGHWELGGLVLTKPFPTYPKGFPDEIIGIFTKETGMKILGNYPASGTEIIKALGAEHVKTGFPIVYTSADSVFQIAAHEEIIPLEKLYGICRVARAILKDENAVARVIARPFTGNEQSGFERTKNRKDFSLPPPGLTILNLLQNAGIRTVAIGKINDLYAHSGIGVSLPTKGNEEGMQMLEHAVEQYDSGLIMANLVDFDMLWGHRNDPEGFYGGLMVFDHWLKHFLPRLRKHDLLFITADHGNDPTTPSTDHSREYVPILIFGHPIKTGVDLGIRNSFADLHSTIAEYLGINPNPAGESFWPAIANE
jgi:phosphopentomutase